MMQPIWIVLLSYLLFFPLCAHTPRLLVTLGQECDFSAETLAQSIEARVITGSEQGMANQIREQDLSDLTHLIVLDAPIQDLSQFALKLFYDHIHLDYKWDTALTILEEKIRTVPVTDADLDTISPEARGQFYHLMAMVSTILQHHKIPFWAISGTLLGAVRHHGMVPWDDDLDIIIPVKNKRQLEALNSILNDNGLQLFVYHNYFYKIFPIDGSPIYAADGSVYPWKYPFLDIFPVNKLNNKICIVSHNYPSINLYPACGEHKGWWLYPHEIEQPPLFASFGPLQIPIPHDSDKILTREYGPDWSVSAYMLYNHEMEKARKRIKVAITDYASPEYVTPK